MVYDPRLERYSVMLRNRPGRLDDFRLQFYSSFIWPYWNKDLLRVVGVKEGVSRPIERGM